MRISDIPQTPLQPAMAKKVARTSGGAEFEKKLDAASSGRSQEAQVYGESEALTRSEKQYFEQLFPDAEEVRTYNPYRRGQADRPVRLGTILDRKG